MKNALLLLYIALSCTVAAQGSWVNVILQTDTYAGETNWQILNNAGEVVAESGILFGNSYSEQIIDMPAGEYEFVITDSFGDGICCGFGEGYFGLGNACGLETYVYDFNTSELVLPFNLLPCPPPVLGCMNPEASNFNPWANVPQGCVFPPAQCEGDQVTVIATTTLDSYPTETSWDLTVNGNSLATGGGYSSVGTSVVDVFCLSVGDSLVASVYDTFGDGFCGTCWGGIDGGFSLTTLCDDTLYFVGEQTQFDTASSNTVVIQECFLELEAGCMNSNYLEYNPEAVQDDGSCLTDVFLGCTDSTMYNYDVNANVLEMHPVCEYSLTITDGGGDGWFGSWLGVTQGNSLYGPFQMGPDDGFEESFVLNLNSYDQVSLFFFTEGNAESTAAQCGFSLTGPNGLIIEAGTNPWTDPIKKFPYEYTATASCQDYCELIVEGCLDTTAVNYDQLANTGIESCYYSPGCTQAGYVEYYDQGFEADFEDGSCDTLAVFGCTDVDAINFDVEANVDNASCVAVVEGCFDVDAWNYNEFANVATDDCLYDAGCTGGPGNPYWANDLCYSWVINVDPYCCETEWDNTCVDLYSYCEQGLPTDVTSYSNSLSLYPNPVIDQLYIKCTSTSETAVYNSFGQLIIEPTSSSRIDMSSLPAGVYTVAVVANGRSSVVKVIKK